MRKDSYKKTEFTRNKQKDFGYFDGRFVERSEIPPKKFSRKDVEIDIDTCECGNISSDYFYPYCSQECLDKNNK